MRDAPLFSSFQLGDLLLPNRIVMAPMTRSRGGEARVPTAVNATYYAQRATAGLIITEATQVSQQGIGYVGTPGIHSDAQIDGWRLVTDAVHAEGGRIYAQLWHVGRVSHTSFQPDGGAPVAPSAIAIEGLTWTSQGQVPFSTPRALETDEIPGIVADFGHGAWAAKQAGFDGVELHGANGYLIDEFLRDGSNKRTDRYGGSIENRARFLNEIVDAVSAHWPAGRIGVRLSPSVGWNGMSDSDPAALFSHVVEGLNGRAGYVHLIDAVSGPMAGATRFAPLLRPRFHGAFIVNGGFDFAAGNDVIQRGESDLVAFGVPFLANPDLPRRFAEGAPLNPPRPQFFYAGGAEGYVDYPALG